jgi:hypothetical protein
MKENDLLQLTAKLHETNLTLDSFLRDSETLSQLDQSVSSGTHAKQLVGMFEAVQEHANNLYLALDGCCETGCQSAHRVMLHLEDRVGVLDHKPLLSKGVDHNLEFQLAIAHTDSINAKSSNNWIETFISVGESTSPAKASW